MKTMNIIDLKLINRIEVEGNVTVTGHRSINLQIVSSR